MLNPVVGDSKKLNQAIAAAHKKGIKIVIVDSQVKTKQVDCTITSANYHAGVLCARELMQNKKHARILLLEHQTAISAVKRIKGFVDTIKKLRTKIIKSLVICKLTVSLKFLIRRSDNLLNPVKNLIRLCP